MFVLARFFSCLTYSNLLRFPFFMKLAHRHLFAVLFSFQRTIALSDLISLSRHFSFVKQIFLFFLCFFRAVCRLTDGGYYPTILFIFCQAGFFRFYRHFRFCSHLFFCFYSHLPLPTAPPPPSPTSGDGFSVWVNSSIWGSAYISIFPFLLILAPFVNLSVDTLSKAKRLTHFYSVAPLLEKWFACFPTSGDSLRFVFFFPCESFHYFLFLLI